MISPTQNLPDHLAERTRVIQDTSTNVSSVVYWMRSALRLAENPALDVACLLANQLNVPLLIYHGLSEHYEFASDRHHTFILQGARDVQQHCKELGLSYAFHLATPKDRKPHLVSLAEQSGCVVTEDMPVDPPRRFLDRLSERCTATIVAVDTACVVPMQMSKTCHTRAFKFRSATKKLYAERTTRSWPERADSPKPFDLSRLPFRSRDWTQESIAAAVAECEIDHAVGPVVDTRGGTVAGLQRWQAFLENGLRGYAKRRNNALIDGVSRMSAYLHYGMVSPFQLAREASMFDHEGAEKYLDELLIWRELSYHFCFHRPDHDSWSAIPDWAQQTLNRHAGDPRPAIYSWEQLARGKTDDPLWNAAQTSLLMQGELHNNVRMTWGKAILQWASTPQEALRLILDLNHRYALDGRDPNSFGGILWCLGQFDRPFEPEVPILGSVRPRPTQVHAIRLPPEKFMAKVAAPRFGGEPKIAVIGAGLSGLSAARTLSDHGLSVTVFEKSRGLGGRMSTRRQSDEFQFDHGAQYFTVRDPRFRRYVDSWIQQGLVAAWPNRDQTQRIVVLRHGQIESESTSQERFVGCPGMNAICKHLGEDLSIIKHCRILKIESTEQTHLLLDERDQQHGPFTHVIVSTPAGQAADLLTAAPILREQVNAIELEPCWAAMFAFDQPLTNDWAGAFVHESPIRWAARNSTKPDRDANLETLVLHASASWSQQHWEEDPENVARQLLTAFWRASGLKEQSPFHIDAHRWRYSMADEPSQAGCFYDEELGLGACGDWAYGSRVEGAFLSGMSIAGRVLSHLEAPVSERPKQGHLF